MLKPDKWIKTWMDIAHTIALRSKDPSTQCGAVIVDYTGKQFLGMGFNGPPKHIRDNSFDWNDKDKKYSYVFHAEDNALYYALAAHGQQKLHDAILIVTGEPCYRCVLNCIRSELCAVIYDDTEQAKQPKMCDDVNREKVEWLSMNSYTKVTPYSKAFTYWR